MNESKPMAGISGYWLKMIAVITMLIDHIAASILERMIQIMPSWGPVNAGNVNYWKALDLVLRGIGRMAFPIYCFLLVEGFTYTRSRAKYACRLFLFALISEVPFDMALNKSFFNLSYNNVFFTLLIGLLTIMATDWIATNLSDHANQNMNPTLLHVLRTIALILVFLLGCIMAEIIFKSDYGASGIVVVYLLYMFRKNRIMGFAIAVFALSMLAGNLELAALLVLIPLRRYDGTRGRQHKYFFYAFYPAHLLVLALLCQLMGLGI